MIETQVGKVKTDHITGRFTVIIPFYINTFLLILNLYYENLIIKYYMFYKFLTCMIIKYYLLFDQ